MFMNASTQETHRKLFSVLHFFFILRKIGLLYLFNISEKTVEILRNPRRPVVERRV